MQVLITVLYKCCGGGIVASLLAKELQNLGAIVKIHKVDARIPEGKSLVAKYHCPIPCLIINDKIFTPNQLKGHIPEVAKQIYSSIPIIQDFKNNIIFK